MVSDGPEQARTPRACASGGVCAIKWQPLNTVYTVAPVRDLDGDSASGPAGPDSQI